ncbi:hypothetical protein OPV22_001700 [Ensete ventricosum]|uniref:Uncharacterized protein n=1 Tax=Ensete ventricosum TaxID=4639 RepID=A0AAV8QD33_ENSVE|nr:hypothetical protein OPV22_001700 [Ensete ventricosum]
MWLSRVWSWLMGPTEDEEMPDLESGYPMSPQEVQPMPDLESDHSPYAPSSSSSSGTGFHAEVSMEQQLDDQIQSCKAECRRLQERIVPIIEALRAVRKGPSWQQELKDCVSRKGEMEQDRERLSKEYQDCESTLKRLLTMVGSKKKGKAISSSPPS